MLAEDPLEGEAQPFGGVSRRLVAAVAFPFQPPVAPVLEHALHHAIQGLGTRATALQGRGKMDMPDLDRAHGGIGAHPGSLPQGSVLRSFPVEQGHEQGIAGFLQGFQPGTEFLVLVKGSVGQPGPALAFDIGGIGPPQVGSVPFGIERQKPDMTPLDDFGPWRASTGPVQLPGFLQSRFFFDFSHFFH